MGDVYRGYERTLNRPVAIKVLPADLAESAEFVRRFRTEAAAVARINHPNIVPIHFIGEDQGHHFYVMQLVEGESLASLLDRRGKLAVDETLAIVEHALAGLAAAHEQGMVHRDIKPGNILLDTRNRRALLADFGLVKSLEASVTGHTATGVIMGTVDYISPEQARGQAVDGRSDLYSVGVLLYQMLAGRLPFEADSPTALIFQHVYEQPPPLSQVAPEVPAALAAIIEKLLAKSPADRHQSADEVLADLRTFRTGQPVPPRRCGRATGQAAIVRLPAVDEEALPLPAGLADLAPAKWWQRTRGRVLSLFRRHAPEILQRLQNTQQQVDGAVAEYDRRERHLRQLTRDAESVLTELKTLAGEHRAAALAARERARSAEDAPAAAQANEEQAASERAAAELDRQISDQQDQLDSIRLRLARVHTQAQELRNRRDILNARLKAAFARRQVAAGGGGRSPRRAWRLALQIAAAILVGPVIFGVVRYVPAPPKSPEVHQGGSGASPQLGTGSQSRAAATGVNGPVTPASTDRWFPEWAGVEKHLALSRDGTLLAVSTHVPPKRDGSIGSASRNRNEIKLWNLRTGEEILSFDKPHYVMNMAVSGDASKLFSLGKVPGTETTEFSIWDLQSGKLMERADAGIPPYKPSLGFSPDSQSAYFLLGASLTQELGIFDVNSRKLDRMKMPQSGDQATAAAFSPTEDIAAIGIIVTQPGGRCAIDIHDMRERKMVHSFAPGNTVCQLHFSGDGRILAGSVWGTVVVWETSNWTQVASFPVATSMHDRLAVSADGGFIAALLNGKVEICNVATKTSVALKASFTCRDIAFTPGGTLIVAPEDLRFAFFNPETGQEQLTPALGPKS
jgi:phage shock protein A